MHAQVRSRVLSRYEGALQKRFAVEDEGELSDLLGVDFSFDDGVVSMTQSNYVTKLAETYLPEGLQTNVRSARVPYSDSLESVILDAVCQVDSDVDPALRKRYQSLVGALLYCATNTRPDVAFAVGQLCRCMSKPTLSSLEAAVLTLRYLYRTRDIGLRFQASDRRLHGYSDSDLAVKHSTSGWVFRLQSAAISWGSKKQKSVALSSCEAEITAASEAGKEAVHLAALSRELGLCDDQPIDLMMDNTAAIDVAYNPEHHGRMKHVARRHFYIRELVEDHVVRCPFVSTVDNFADFFTKGLPPKKFTHMRDQIMNVRDDLREVGIAATGGRSTERVPGKVDHAVGRAGMSYRVCPRGASPHGSLDGEHIHC